ncbi:protein kinase domain-containing protein [Streptodolium elevatio]|uniref:Protein kinase n=1 Tax=Streptodolium elevatio TaxID=3157996 RepID=A0ABV3DHX2_9ACTN
MRPLHKDDPRQIGGHRLVAVLGEGATAQVFLGATPEGRPIVLKAVRPVPARDPAFRTRFAHDVAAAERIACPYAVPVLDACTDGPVLWLATSYTPGPGLGEAVAKYGPMPPRTVRTLAAGLAAALEALHGVGLVHGRLGPTQVSLAPDGPRVVDLGVARSPDGPSVTEAGVVVGTVLPSPGFRAPEQLDGRRVGPAADVFSLGCVIVHAATGTGPFGADTAPGVTERVLYGIPELRVLPSWLRELAAACLAKAPEDRPTPAQVHAATASELDGPGWLPHGIAAEVAQRAATVWAHSGAATPGTGPTMVPRTPPGPPSPSARSAGAAPTQPVMRPITESVTQSVTPAVAQASAAPPTPVTATPVAATVPPAGNPPGNAPGNPPGTPSRVPPQPSVPPGARPFRDASARPASAPATVAQGAVADRNTDGLTADSPDIASGVGPSGAARPVSEEAPASGAPNRDLPPARQPKMIGGPGAALHVERAAAEARAAAGAATADGAVPGTAAADVRETPEPPTPPATPAPERRFPMPIPRGPGASTRIGPSRGRRVGAQQPAGPEAAGQAVVGGPGAGAFTADRGSAISKVAEPAATSAASSAPEPAADPAAAPEAAAKARPGDGSEGRTAERGSSDQPSGDRGSGAPQEAASTASAAPRRPVGGPGAGQFTKPTATPLPGKPGTAGSQPAAESLDAVETAEAAEAAEAAEVLEAAEAVEAAETSSAHVAASPMPKNATKAAKSPGPAENTTSAGSRQARGRAARPEPDGPVITVETVETALPADEILDAEIVEAELVDDDEPLPPRASVTAPPGVTDLPGKPAGAVRRGRNGQHGGQYGGQRDGQRGEPHDATREGSRGTRRASSTGHAGHAGQPGRPGRPGDDRERTRGRGRTDDWSRERNHDRPTGPNNSRPRAADAPRPDTPSKTGASATAPEAANSAAARQRSEAKAERRRFLAWVAGGAAVLAGAATGAVLWGDGGSTKPVRTAPVAAPPAAAPGPAAPAPAAPLRVWFRQGSVTAGQLQEIAEALRGTDSRLRLAAESKESSGYARALVSELGTGQDTAPDVFEVDILSLAAHQAAGRIIDLAPYQDRFDTGAWLPAVQSAVKAGDRLLGMPLTASAPVVLYHQGMFAEAGVAVPSTREQWVDGLEQLRTQFADDREFRPLWLPGRSWHVLASLMWGSGGALALREGDTWRGAFDLPGSIDGVRFFRRLQQYAPEAQDLTEDGLKVGELFARGRAASVVGSASLHPTALAADAALGQQLNAFAMPGRTADAPGAVGVQGTALAVSAKCRDVPAAVELLALLATDSWRDQVSRTAGALSPRTVPEQAVFGPNPMLRAGASAVRTSGRAYPAAPGWSERPVLEFGRAVLAGTDAMAAAVSANQLVAAEFGRTTG